MSGTSLDGIDAVLVDFGQDSLDILGSFFMPYDEALKLSILELQHPTHDELHRTQLIGNQLARQYAIAVRSLLEQNACLPEQVKAIGCHGQTIRHCPEQGYTLQIGNAALLAELTGITVISDFRSRDIAAGGQGAPLVPAFHDRILRHPEIHRVIVNIGGISNLTNLAPGQPTTGFDCGPGNLLMDAWCMQHLQRPYDDNGAWAESGKALPGLLDRLLSEPYFNLSPPKSCGRDLFNMTWLESHLQKDEAPEDIEATLLLLTATSIARAIRTHCAGAQQIYLCGGGAHNSALRRAIANQLPDCSIATTSDLNIDGDYLEAIAFAWLARQNLAKIPANLPAVTGAGHPCILGAVHPA